MTRTDSSFSVSPSSAAQSSSTGPDATHFGMLITRLEGDDALAHHVWSLVIAEWNAPERRYHGLGHLRDCLATLGAAREEATFREVADIAELALVYHDVVYEPGARDAEERSAQRLIADARTLRVPSERAEAAAACVRATAHMGSALASRVAEQLVVDVDLAILGGDASQFEKYEVAIRAEYAHIPDVAFAIGRGRFLASLLRRPALFCTPFFRERFEARARANIAAALGSAAYAPHRWARVFAM